MLWDCAKSKINLAVKHLTHAWLMERDVNSNQNRRLHECVDVHARTGTSSASASQESLQVEPTPERVEVQSDEKRPGMRKDNSAAGRHYCNLISSTKPQMQVCAQSNRLHSRSTLKENHMEKCRSVCDAALVWVCGLQPRAHLNSSMCPFKTWGPSVSDRPHWLCCTLLQSLTAHT